MIVHGNFVGAFEEKRDQLLAEKAEKEIHAAAASARRQSAQKHDREAAAIEAAQARAAVTEVNARLRQAEKDLAAAQSEAKKIAKDQAKLEAMNERAEARRIREQLAEDNPLLAFEVNYSALGAWVAERASGRACYTEGAGWGEWTGTHWQFSRKPSAELLDRVRRLYAAERGEVAEKLNSNAKSAENILSHAKGALTVPRDRFNTFAVAHLIAFQNCTVDLRTGDTMPHDPEHYMTGCLQCDYDENADLDRVLRTFARFWPKDHETAEMFQTAIGYSATGEVAAKRSFFMVGNQDNALQNGDNGKSLVQDALVKLFGIGLGGWGAAVKPGIILDTGDRDANSHDGAKTPLIWRRMAMSSEPRKGSSIEAGEFKRLSGGDVQSARPPHAEHAVEFVNFASFWMSLNDMPRFKSFDRATRVRLTPFPFTETFYDPGTAPEGGQEKEFGLKEWLESEDGQKALALYVVSGAMKYYAANDGKAGNFPDSARVAELREQIMKNANPYREMFENWLEFSPRADVTKSSISSLLSDHLGGRPKDREKSAFEDALRGQGVTEVKVRGIRMWRGVGLTVEGRKVASLRGHHNPDTWRPAVRIVAAE
ncbi:hypothetical protein [Acidimangrovimonas pyrenivorans]|uniref:Bacteriophage/plasmid primase P4 C-terminal domain-containing protein n=1 Tax=Acidimangrovimonas pyrenivorans TaxID=2030798 RepID=A0ABV7ADP0_9RHOB